MGNFGLIRKSGFIIFFFVVSGFWVYSQVTSPLSSEVRYTSYPGEPERKDPIFIFCVPEGNNDFSIGELIAIPPGGIAGCTFDWCKYNPSDSVFDSPFQTDIDVSSSTADSLESGGYKVRIRDAGSMDTSFIAWVFTDRPYDSIRLLDQKCPYVALKGDTGTAPFSYYDTTDNSSILLGNGISFHWWSDPESLIPFPDIEINPVTYQPPYEDTWYYLTVTDSFGCSNEASLFYESIHVKADFEPDPSEGEAPLVVSFTNNSLNADEYEWRFGDDDSISILETPAPHTYYDPNIEYEVVLIARNEHYCVDTFKFHYIKVDPSALDIPNVFTPNEDSYNDKFLVYGKSLQSIYVQIFNRLGKRIYEYTGHGAAIKDWEGWDGKINGRSEASPGIYYYVIRAVGYDDILYKGKEYTGVLYLYREK
ncbi:MAG: gliding motility-associated C-terminal domain-containing protein [Bacteroidales bacterium]|nr:gliding motility-associated C-terminal domain-containing protein [Bacteroidales bacterium]